MSSEALRAQLLGRSRPGEEHGSHEIAFSTTASAARAAFAARLTTGRLAAHEGKSARSRPAVVHLSQALTVVRRESNELTSRGAGLGMDPHEVLVPINRVIPWEQATQSPVARCSCGVDGCGSTDVVIALDGDVVHWDWKIEVPIERRSDRVGPDCGTD